MSFKEVKKVDKNVKERWESINQGLVPKGYKKTKVGIIPEDWEVKKHDHKTNKEYWWNKIEGNIKRGKIINTTLKEQGWTVIRFWSKEIEKDLSSCVAKIEFEINRLREEQK